jgi:hypothetical protein
MRGVVSGVAKDLQTSMSLASLTFGVSSLALYEEEIPVVFLIVSRNHGQVMIQFPISPSSTSLQHSYTRAGKWYTTWLCGEQAHCKLGVFSEVPAVLL